MKLKRIRKNAIYMIGYGCGFYNFKKQIQTSPDSNINRLPARMIKRIYKNTKLLFEVPLNRQLAKDATFHEGME